MEFRRLGQSGFKVPVLSFGTGTFGGSSEFFRAWGETDVEEATRLVDICLEAGVNMFDTADVYSTGMSEEILGKAIAGRRDAGASSRPRPTFRMGPGPNDVGNSRHHLISACEAQPAPARHRLHRPLSAARLRRAHRRSRKRSARSTRSCAAARSATSAARTSPAGT